MTKLLLATLTLAIVATCLSQAAPNSGEYKIREIEADDESRILDTADDDSDAFNLLIPYRPMRPTESIDGRRRALDVSGPQNNNRKQLNNNMVPSESDVVYVPPEPLPKSIVQFVVPIVKKLDDSPSLDRAKSIAFNNREVKLVGPARKEVEVKGDVASQMALALENLQKETTEVWGQVNQKLDKGWTEFKSMVENVAKRASTPSSRQLREAPSKYYGSSSPQVLVSDLEGYSMADEGSDSLAKQAETAGTKIKGFLSNIGLNEENGKKANEALSKAGASVSEAVSKDLPDALKKAGSAVSDTVTKDIPDAFKNFFG